MKRPTREVSIFSLSALDVLATATGVFVLFVVILLPYYQMTEDAGAAIARQRADSGEQQREVLRLQQATEGDRIAAAALRGDSAELAADSAAMGAEADRLQAQITVIEAKLRSGPIKREKPRGNSPLRFIDRLDLVFVIDTTRSMRATLDELTDALGDIVAVLERLVTSLQVGVIGYRDAELGGPVTFTLPLTPTTRIDRIQHFFDTLEIAPRGGATVEEDVYTALREATELRFRRKAVRHIILIGDAAAHPAEQAASIDLARRFHRSDDSSVSTVFIATGAYRSFGSNDREFFTDLAAAGGGQFSQHRGRMIESILLSVLQPDPKLTTRR